MPAVAYLSVAEEISHYSSVCLNQGCQEPFLKGRDYSTVDGRSKRKCYWARASCDCARLQIGNVTREVEFLSNDYTNPNTNTKTLTTLALTLADHHDAFE